MSDTTTIEPKSAFVRYERKRQPEKYGVSQASVSIPVELPEAGPTDEFWNQIGTALQAAKIEVLNTLEIGYDLDLETGSIKERAVAVVEDRPSGGSGDVATGGTFESRECPKCAGAMWDNRKGKKNPKAPDFKCKDRDCDGVIWPPR